MQAGPTPDTDAAIVLGMASTAMPFAGSADEQAERWLRILRAHGPAGIALQALGVSEAPLESRRKDVANERTEARADGGPDIVAAVTEGAVRVAGRRGARSLGTGDVLVAVMEVYGTDFDRVLRSHGTDRDEVLERLAAEQPAGEDAREAG
jgi:hypothetical protein